MASSTPDPRREALRSKAGISPHRRPLGVSQRISRKTGRNKRNKVCALAYTIHERAAQFHSPNTSVNRVSTCRPQERVAPARTAMTTPQKEFFAASSSLKCRRLRTSQAMNAYAQVFPLSTATTSLWYAQHGCDATALTTRRAQKHDAYSQYSARPGLGGTQAANRKFAQGTFTVESNPHVHHQNTQTEHF